MITIRNENTLEFQKGIETELRKEGEDFRDLMNDFEFVKELNKELSLKFQDFVDSLPKPSEVDIITDYYNDILKSSANIPVQTREVYNKRIFQLRRFRTACVLLEQQDHNQLPPEYEEIFK